MIPNSSDLPSESLFVPVAFQVEFTILTSPTVSCNCRYVVLVDRSVASDVAETQPLVLPRGLMGRELHNLLAATGQLSCPGVTEFCPHLVGIQQQHFLPPFTSETIRTPTKPSSCHLASPNPSPPKLPFSPRRLISPPIHSASPKFYSPANGPPEDVGIDLRNYGASGQLVLVRAILGALNTDEVSRKLP